MPATLLRLRPLRPDDATASLALHAALAEEGFPFLLDHRPGEPWAAYLGRLEDQRCGRNLPADRVPATFLAAAVGHRLVGRVSVRHELNDHLAAFGGHIGYGVAPAHRRHGYATEICRQALVVARAAGVDRVLVTCDAGNAGSAAVIERCGGVLEAVVERPAVAGRGPTLMRRYWID